MQEYRDVRRIERGCQGIGMRTEAHGIAARFECRDDARRADFRAQAVEGAANGGGVVSEIIVDGDATRDTHHLQAPLGAGEARKSRQQRLRIAAHRRSRGKSRQCVHHVMAAQQRPFDNAQRMAAMQHGETRAVRRQQLCGPVEHGIARVGRGGASSDFGHTRRIDDPEPLHRGPAAHRQHLGQRGILAVDDEPPAPRHDAHKVVELALDGLDVGEDIGVVVFEVVQHRHRWPVVHKLAALVEEGRVVLVGLDDEFRAGTQPRRHTEVFRHAADEKAGVPTRGVEQESQ